MSDINYQEEKQRDEVARRLMQGYRDCIRERGIDEKRLAEELDRGLNATKVEIQKVKGKLDTIDSKWSVVVECATAQVKDEATGKAITIAKGDTLVTTELIDHGIRQKVRKDAEYILGLSDQTEEAQRKSIIIVKTEVPEPQPRPEYFDRIGEDGRDSRFEDREPES